MTHAIHKFAEFQNENGNVREGCCVDRSATTNTLSNEYAQQRVRSAERHWRGSASAGLHYLSTSIASVTSPEESPG